MKLFIIFKTHIFFIFNNMIFEIQTVQMNHQTSSLSGSFINTFVGVLLYLYFGSNTVCSEVFYLIFIAHFILVSYFVSLSVFLFIQLCTVNI